MPSEAELEAAYRQACDRKDDPAALAAAERLVQEFPDCPWHWLWLARQQRNAGQLSEAERALEQAQARNPDPRCAHHIFISWGLIRSGQGQYALAEEAFLGSLAEAYNDYRRSLAWFFTGFAQRRQGQFRDAERSFCKALELRPDYDEAMFNLARCIEDLEQPDHARAIGLLRRALEINPDKVLPIRELGRLLWLHGDAGEAEQLLRRSLSLCPEDELIYKYLAQGLAREGRTRDVLSVWKAAKAALPAWPVPGIESCVAHLRLEETELAEASLRQTLTLDGAGEKLVWAGRGLLHDDDDGIAERLAVLAIQCGQRPPTLSEMRLVQARALHQLDRYGEAVATMEQLLDEDPDNARALGWAGRILRESNVDRAIACSRRAVEIDPENRIAFRELGITLLFGKRQFKEAEQCLRTALFLDEKDDFARYLLAVALRFQGDDSQAEAELLRVAELNPGFSSAYSELARIHRARGEYAEAEMDYCKAIELDPDEAGYLADLGWFLARLDRNDEARPLFRRALCLDPDLDEADEIRAWLSLYGQ